MNDIDKPVASPDVLGDWRVALDANRLNAVRERVFDMAQETLKAHKRCYPDIEARLADKLISTPAKAFLDVCVSAYFSAPFPDPIFDPDEMAVEARHAVKVLRRVQALAEKLPYRSRLWLKELHHPDLESSLDEAITFFKTNFPAARGPKPNIALDSSIGFALSAFALMTGRRFRKNLKLKESGFENADVFFIKSVFQEIDPLITDASIKSALQKVTSSSNLAKSEKPERRPRNRRFPRSPL